MKKVVDTLVKLQEVDSRLYELKLQKGDLPNLIEYLGEDLKGKRTKSSELSTDITKLHSERKMFEKEIEASKSELAKYEGQLYKVQNNKEYDAISLEIDTKKMEIEGLENKIFQALENEEDLKKEISLTKNELKDIDSQLEKNKQELEEISVYTKEEEANLLRQREKVFSSLDKRYVAQYERIRKAKKGLAVVPIERGSCGGCFSALPPQFIIEVRESNHLYTCEYCGRFLVWPEIEEETATKSSSKAL